jgi:hypothetical protein
MPTHLSDFQIAQPPISTGAASIFILLAGDRIAITKTV